MLSKTVLSKTVLSKTMLAKTTLAALTLLTAVAQANDGGIAYVDVQGIKPEIVDSRSKKQISVEDGSVIWFYGKDAEQFMHLLPKMVTVVDSMVPADEAALRQANQRTLAIVSDKWQLRFDCNGANIVQKDRSNGSSEFKVVKADQTKCSISINRNPSPALKLDMLGDAFKLDRSDKSQLTCQ